jgi:DNA-binding MarR family transcriptional regulator
MGNTHSRGAWLIVNVLPALMGWLASDLRKAEPNLTPGHFYALLVLSEGACNLSDLASRLEISLPTMSNTVSRLLDRGWVTSNRDAADHRRLLIAMTDQGWGVLEAISEGAQRKAQELLDSLPAEECRRVSDGLEILGRALDDERLSCSAAVSSRRRPIKSLDRPEESLP